jgi:chromosomal replication initiation ATPase DnaA
MTRATFDAWLATATARRDEDTLVIQLAHARAIDWISNRLHGTIVRAVRRAFAEDELSIVYELQGEPGRRRT